MGIRDATIAIWLPIAISCVFGKCYLFILESAWGFLSSMYSMCSLTQTTCIKWSQKETEKHLLTTTMQSISWSLLGNKLNKRYWNICLYLTVTIWPMSRWIPFIWAMKIAATASYRAVPSMLMVAPTGSTKRVTLLSIPKFSSRQRKVTGRVPALQRPDQDDTLHPAIKEVQHLWSIFFRISPGSCTEGSDPGLEDPEEEGVRVFPDDNKVDAGQEDRSVNDEANDHSHHVHAQLPSDHFKILDGNDLATNQTGNTEGRVPDRWIFYFITCILFFIYQLQSVTDEGQNIHQPLLLWIFL